LSEVSLHFNENIDFGKTLSVIVPHKGDMLIDAYLKFTLPPLTKTSGTYAAYTNSIGHALISSVAVQIGGETVDLKTGMTLNMESDLDWNLDDNSGGLIGKYTDLTTLQSNATTQRVYYIPLSFWFRKHLGDALPLLALRGHQIKFIVVVNSFNNVVVYDGTTPPSPVPMVDATVEITYAYLDKTERMKILQPITPNSSTTTIPGRIMMITQTQMLSVSIPAGNTAAQVPLPFNHPVTELKFAFVDDTANANNDLFNYSIYNSSPVSPFLSQARLLLDGKAREDDPIPEQFLRMVNSYRFHKNTLDKFLYLMSFAHQPEDVLERTSGALNMSMFDTVLLDLTMQSGNPGCTLNVFATNINFLYIHNNMAAVMFAA